jgi:hypothetical protein
MVAVAAGGPVRKLMHHSAARTTSADMVGVPDGPG